MPKKQPKETKESSPGAFKNFINADVLKKIARAIGEQYPKFDFREFLALAPRLEMLELKQRVQLVRDGLKAGLPQDYEKAVSILLRSLEAKQLEGFALWPYTEFVQTYGLDHFDVSLNALYVLTQRFTAEFAIRPFLVRYPEKTLKKLDGWISDESADVRRWVSEGTRPRLPWGARLPDFIRDPAPTLKILEKLKHDSELYVRKSVANHLNDISKDNPKEVIRVLSEWVKNAPEEHASKIDWIKRHALRTLIKQGHMGALSLMGVGKKTQVKVRSLRLSGKSLNLGDRLEFEFELVSEAARPQRVVVDYIIHHAKAGERASPKVFKLKMLDLAPGQRIVLKKNHHFKPVTVRRYYSGAHALEIQVNGKVHARAKFGLEVV